MSVVRKAHTRRNPKTGKPVHVAAHPVRTPHKAASVADMPLRGVAPGEPFVSPVRPLTTFEVASQGRGPHHVDAVTFAATFFPTEYGSTWEEVTDVVQHPGLKPDGFLEEVGLEELSDQIHEEGGMLEPVSVHDGRWVVDGHHRVCVALQEGLPVKYEHVPSAAEQGQSDYLALWKEERGFVVPATLTDESVKFGNEFLTSLGDRGVSGTCWVAARNLQERVGLPVCEGTYVDGDGNRTPHVWNVMPDGETIVDVTAGQFTGRGGVHVVGPKDRHAGRYVPKRNPVGC